MSRRNFKPSAEQLAKSRERRAALIARSVPIQIARKSGLLPWAELENVNACLRLQYQNETGASEWNTFKGWRDAGRPVRKGERGFAVWGKPLDRKADDAGADNGAEQFAEAEAQEAARGFSFFPLAYIFHGGQVESADAYAARVQQLESEGLTTSDAQSVADMESEARP